MISLIVNYSLFEIQIKIQFLIMPMRMKDNLTNVVLLKLAKLRLKSRKSEHHEYRSKDMSCEIAQLIDIPINT